MQCLGSHYETRLDGEPILLTGASSARAALADASFHRELLLQILCRAFLQQALPGSHRVESGNHVEQFFIDATLTKPMEPGAKFCE